MSATVNVNDQDLELGGQRVGSVQLWDARRSLAASARNPSTREAETRASLGLIAAKLAYT